MAQLEHTTPGLAPRLYARSMRLDECERARLRQLVDGVEAADIAIRPADDGSTTLRPNGPENDETLRERVSGRSG